MNRQDSKNLKKRYLVWFYKQTKESLDKIDRKFTQVEIDQSILRELKKNDKASKLKSFIEEFEAYIRQKEKNGLDLKYENGKVKSEYLFLSAKLAAIEKTILKELGKATLIRIKEAYEAEMTKRILEERQQKV